MNHPSRHQKEGKSNDGPGVERRDMVEVGGIGAGGFYKGPPSEDGRRKRRDTFEAWKLIHPSTPAPLSPDDIGGSVEMDPSQHIERRPSKFVDGNGVSREGTLGASRDVTFSTLRESTGSNRWVVAELSGVGVDRETVEMRRKELAVGELDSPVVRSGDGVVDECPVLGRGISDEPKKEMGRERSKLSEEVGD